MYVTNTPVHLSEEQWTRVTRAFLNEKFGNAFLYHLDQKTAYGMTQADALLEAIRDTAVSSIVQQSLADSEQGPLTVGSAAAFDLNQLQGLELPKTLQPRQFIWVTFQKEGIHLYPAASTDPKLATGGWDDVSFLGYPHRHIFHFRVAIEVFHDDRDIEFIQFKRWLEGLYASGTLELNHRSCEMIGNELYKQIIARHPGRAVQIEVSEDGENGATMIFEV